MARQIKLRWTLFLLSVISDLPHWTLGAEQVPCYFIFGDSMYDNGNNNGLETLAKVNYRPYGIDFPNGPTGRFSNGATIVDFIAKHLGFENYIPSFASGPSDVLKGVNYASGSAGIRDETGQQQGAHVSFGKQLENHKVITDRIVANMGSKDSAAQHLNKCVYSVGIGNNDYINNYFLPDQYNTSKQYNPEQYAQVLIDQYSKQLRTLYSEGARKIALFGLGTIGCTPNAISSFQRPSGALCVDNMNNAIILFNNKLKSLVDQLNTDLPQAKFTYINLLGMGLAAPAAAGLKFLNTTCCPVVSKTGLCEADKAPCENRNEYAYWDAFHPTEAVNKHMAQRSYKALETSDAHPYDISRLIQQ